MPDATLGFTGTEIVTRVQRFVGNDSADFTSFVENTLAMAEFRFCKAHDWKFLHKSGLTLNITNGTSQYDLSIATIGYYMACENVDTIYSPDGSIVLAKREEKDVRRADPETDDGNSDIYPQVWFPVGDNKIEVWPPDFKTSTLKLDGMVTPGSLVTMANYPTIPFRYQESFIEYVIAIALDRENDDRASGKKAEAMALIKEDIKDDMRELGGVTTPRIKSMFEARYDGRGTNLEALLYGSGFYDDWGY